MLFNQSQVFFFFYDLLKQLHEVTKNPDRYKGSVFLYEEPQGEQSNKRTMSTASVSFTTVLSNFRSLNCVLVMTTPYLSQINKDIRDYCDLLLETDFMDYHNKICYCKPKFTEMNKKYNQVFHKFPIVVDVTTHQTMTLKSLGFPLPSERLVREYEQAKLKYQKDSFKAMLEKTEGKDSRGDTSTVCPICSKTKGKWFKEGWRCYSCLKITIEIDKPKVNPNRPICGKCSSLSIIALKDGFRCRRCGAITPKPISGMNATQEPSQHFKHEEQTQKRKGETNAANA